MPVTTPAARTTRANNDRRAVLAVGAVAAVLYSSFLLEVVLPGRHHWTVVVSNLETPGSPLALPLRSADVASGLLVLALLPAVRTALPRGRWRTAGLWSTAVFAVTNAAAAAVTLPCSQASACASTADQVQRWVHDGLSAASTTALALGAAALAVDAGRHHLRSLRRAGWFTFWVTSVAGSALLGLCHALEPASGGTGLSQRVQITLTSLWILYLAYVASATLESREASDCCAPRG